MKCFSFALVFALALNLIAEPIESLNGPNYSQFHSKVIIQNAYKHISSLYKQEMEQISALVNKNETSRSLEHIYKLMGEFKSDWASKLQLSDYRALKIVLQLEESDREFLLKDLMNINNLKDFLKALSLKLLNTKFAKSILEALMVESFIIKNGVKNFSRIMGLENDSINLEKIKKISIRIKTETLIHFNDPYKGAQIYFEAYRTFHAMLETNYVSMAYYGLNLTYLSILNTMANADKKEILLMQSEMNIKTIREQTYFGIKRSSSSVLRGFQNMNKYKNTKIKSYSCEHIIGNS